MIANSLKVFVMTLVICVFSINASAQPFSYWGATSGEITSADFDPFFVQSWPSVGDKVYFYYNFECLTTSCQWPESTISTHIHVPAFSDTPFITTSDFNYPEITYHPTTQHISYLHAFDDAIPDDWFKMKPGIKYGWWQEILQVEGKVGGEWSGEVYYYISVADWDNEIFDAIEGSFTFRSSPVPEPRSIILFGLGILAITFLAGKYKRNRSFHCNTKK